MFNVERFKKEKICIKCDTADECDQLLDICNSNDMNRKKVDSSSFRSKQIILYGYPNKTDDYIIKTDPHNEKFLTERGWKFFSFKEFSCIADSSTLIRLLLKG